MPENNIVILHGTLASEPLLNALPNGTPYLQVFLLVERTHSQRALDARGKEVPSVDVLRVVRYGAQAEADFFYLQKGATIVVMGWNQSRTYMDRRGGRETRRSQIEVNAQTIVYGRNCNFERGDRRKADREERDGRSSLGQTLAQATDVTEQLLKVLLAEAD